MASWCAVDCRHSSPVRYREVPKGEWLTESDLLAHTRKGQPLVQRSELKLQEPVRLPRTISAGCAWPVESHLLRCLAPMEGGLAFLLKGRDRLTMILGREGQQLIADRSVHHAMGELLEANIHRRFRPADRLRRASGQSLRQLVHMAVEFLVRDDMVDQADAFGLARWQQVARQQIFLRPGVANELRPNHGTAIACHEPHPHMRIPNPCTFSSIAHVAQQRDGGPKPDTRPWDARDDRLL